MALGRADAPVTIIAVRLDDLPLLPQVPDRDLPASSSSEYIDTGKVRYILREFPIGKQSGLATIALRCAPPDKYFALYDKLMAQQAVLGQPGGAPRPHLQGGRAGGDDARAV